ncbi:MAG TPA: plastocyanin/azurin family copper-binding protein [Egibacteraceae bacterium]|nr:plastocyanin/azurin family copper-binding protein [Egibacteraceae bacterium]
MSALGRSALAVAVALGTTAGSYSLAAREAPAAADPLGPESVTVVIDIEHSRFSPSSLSVKAGTEVRFVVRNHDPINHELIIGPAEVHDRHRDGTEAEHAAVPGEVSVAALERGVTSYRFEEPGTVEMACHLPRHYEFGMRGEITVVDAAP